MQYNESKKHREERGELAITLGSFADRLRQNPEDSEALEGFDKIEAEIRNKDQLIAAAERVERAEEFRSPTPGKPAQSQVWSMQTAELALRGQLMEHTPKFSKYMTPEIRRAMEKCGTGGNHIRMEHRSVNSLSAGAGGNLTQDALLGELQKAIELESGLRKVCRVVSTGEGDNWPIPTSNNLSRMAKVRGQTDDYETTDALVWGRKTLGSFCFYDVARVTTEMIRDTQFPLIQWVAQELGAAIGRKQGTDMALGGGTTTAWGLLERATTGKITASFNEITYAEWVEFVRSIPAAVAASGKVKLVISYSAETDAMTMVDENGRPMWVPSMAVGQPNTILGIPYVVDPFYEAMGVNGNIVATVGDHSFYWWRDVGVTQLTVLNELYKVSEGAYGYLGEKYGDGDYIVPASYNPIMKLVLGASAS